MCPARALSSTELIQVDGTNGSGLIPKPGGCLNTAGGGRTGGIQLRCGLQHLQAQAPGLLGLAEPSGPTFWWYQYQLQA